MFYHFLYPLASHLSMLNIFRYITFRTIYAAITAFVICFILGPWIIRKLQKLQIGQYIRNDGPQTHLSKAGTPTMGGLLIVFSTVATMLLWGNFSNSFTWILLLVFLAFAGIGFIDDYRKVTQKNSRGLTARQKLVLQCTIGLAAGVFLCVLPDFDTKVTIPFFKTVLPDLQWGYAIFTMFVIVGAANAVNLTDGLDGLASGPIVIATTTYMILAYVAGHVSFALYLQIPYVANSSEVAVFCGALAGAGLGFLWFNTYPAQVFMGDVGSLSLGAAIGTIAILTKQELLLLIIGGLFVIEALSVISQVFFFKATKGKRIFKMAPIHHHFELSGWAEPKVIVRFWIISIILSVIALSTLKLR